MADTASGNPSFLSVSVRNANGDQVDVSSGLVSPDSVLSTEKNENVKLSTVIDSALAAVPTNENGGIADVVITTDDNSNPVFTATNEKASILVTQVASTKPVKQGLVGYILGFCASLNAKINSLGIRAGNLSTDGTKFTGDVTNSNVTLTVADQTSDTSVQNVLQTVFTGVLLNQNKTEKLSYDGSVFSGAVKTSGSEPLVINSSIAIPTSLTDAGTTDEVRFDDANGIIYRCTKGGTAGNATWQKFYATSAAPLTDGMNGDPSEGALQFLADVGVVRFMSGRGMIGLTEGVVTIASKVPAPTSTTDAGAVNEIRFDNNYMYRCVTGGNAGDAKWVRFPIDSTWT